MIQLRQDTRHMERVSRNNILRSTIHFFAFRLFMHNDLSTMTKAAHLFFMLAMGAIYA